MASQLAPSPKRKKPQTLLISSQVDTQILAASEVRKLLVQADLALQSGELSEAALNLLLVVQQHLDSLGNRMDELASRIRVLEKP